MGITLKKACLFLLEEELEELPICIYHQNDLPDISFNCLRLSHTETDGQCSQVCFRKQEEDLIWHCETISFNQDIEKQHYSKLPISDLYAFDLSKFIEQHIYIKRYRSKYEELTAREKEVLALIGEGKSNKSIAGKLSISTATIKQHRKNIKRKLDAQSLADLIFFAQAFGLVEQ